MTLMHDEARLSVEELLLTAQRHPAADWIAAYRKYFHADAPLKEPR